MYKSLLLILCLLLGTMPTRAQKRNSKHRTPTPAERRGAAAAEREFGAASRAYEKQEKLEKARLKEQRAQQPVRMPEPLPVPVPSAVDLPGSPLPSAQPALSKRELEAELRRAMKEPTGSKHPAAHEQREKPRREEPRARGNQTIPMPDPLPSGTAKASTGASNGKAAKALPPSVSAKVKAPTMPKSYGELFYDRNRAINPRKVDERKKFCRQHEDDCKHPNRTVRNEFRFPIKPDKSKRGPIVKDALGQTIGRLALTMPAEVRPGVKRQVPQQISINKDEGQMVRVKGKLVPHVMAPGLLLTNGRHVSALVPLSSIPASDRPKSVIPKRSRPSNEKTVSIPITGGNPFLPTPTLTGIDSSGKSVPLKFGDPKFSPPRGYNDEHKEGNDYLPRLINSGPLKTEYYINVLGNKLPGGGGGGIARTVIKIDRNDPTPPIFDAYKNRSPILRKLYLPNRTEERGSILLIPGRLRGAEGLGTVYIAAPNLPYLPPPPRKH